MTNEECRIEPWQPPCGGQFFILHSAFIIQLNPWLVSSTNSHPALSKSQNETKGLGRLIYFAFRGSKMVRASGNAPDPGTHLVRLRL